ncbi:MAG: hypothetical protein JXQ90_19010 [Cyclobacteriaceae bacterium]
MKITKSDWINHSIAFLGMIIGILIALQLDDWREKQELQERIEIAISNVGHELDANRQGLEGIIGSNKMFIDILEFIVEHEIADGIIQFNSEENWLSSKQLEFVEFSEIDSTGSKIRAKVDVNFNLFLTFRIQSHNWEGLKYSGYLSLSNQEDLNEYILIYDLLNTDFGDLDILQLSKRIEAADTNEKTLNVLKENVKPYEVKLNYLNNFLDKKQAGNKR